MNYVRRNIPTLFLILAVIAAYWLFVRRPTSAVTRAGSEETYELVTLLPRDAIPAIDDPQFYDAGAADREYTPDELVLGVDINGERRAYSTALLNQHEIVNDLVGGQPIAVTW